MTWVSWPKPRVLLSALLWVRLLRAEDRGYGYVDDDMPELTVAVKREWRGQGVGTALCCRLFEVVPRMSLSSDVRNPVIGLYPKRSRLNRKRAHSFRS